MRDRREHGLLLRGHGCLVDDGPGQAREQRRFVPLQLGQQFRGQHAARSVITQLVTGGRQAHVEHTQPAEKIVQLTGTRHSSPRIRFPASTDAMPHTVGSAKNSLSEYSAPNRSRTRFSRVNAFSECPPRSKNRA